MKLLIYTSHRTGSTSLATFLGLHYNCEYIRRFHFDTNKSFSSYVNSCDSGIFKVCPEEQSYDEVNHLFDKTIVLVRDNIVQQAESRTFAKLNKKYFSHYTIPEGFFDNHRDELNAFIELIETENKHFKSLSNCLYLSYEELYYSKDGIDKMEKYLNTKFKFTLDNSKKYRDSIKTLI